MKIRPLGAEWIHADARRDVTKLIFYIIALRNFSNAPNNLNVLYAVSLIYVHFQLFRTVCDVYR
jgi:hypothetical protein